MEHVLSSRKTQLGAQIRSCWFMISYSSQTDNSINETTAGVKDGLRPFRTPPSAEFAPTASRKPISGNIMMPFRKLLVFLSQAFYYIIARHLPTSYSYSFIGRLSKKCRAQTCKQFFYSIGRNVNIEHGAYFGSGRSVEIGDNSGIGVDCHVPSDIRIGNDVMMGPEVLIIGRNQNHRFDDMNIPMRLQGYLDTPPVIIEDDVWLGARVIVLPGIKISRGAVIGAGAIVTKDVPPLAICAGNPARLIKYRTDLKE
jgi:maltose O-acetyltransferase